MEKKKDTIILFDVDGTLTKSRNKIEQEMIDVLKKLQSKYYVGIIGGSDKNKIIGQLGLEVFNSMDYAFTENGLYSFKKGELFYNRSIQDELGEENLQKFLKVTLHYLADLEIPIKRSDNKIIQNCLFRGTFIEYRTGMLNVSPIGRNCSQKERDEFEQLDIKTGIRKKLMEYLKKELPGLNLTYSIGGQISFDVFPNGWNKTYALQFLKEYKNIYFFGDKTEQGQNDYEIYVCDETVGYSVKTFQDTIQILNEKFLN